MPSTAAWVDTGFLVALFARDDCYHDTGIAFLREANDLEFHSIWPVVSEASYFLDTAGKTAMLDWLERGPIVFHELGIKDLPEIRATLKKYRDLSPDFTDAALVTLAGIHGIDRIVTVDLRDFSAYRVKGRAGFVRLWL
jgi:predicted nucleic acid-binding protein